MIFAEIIMLVGFGMIAFAIIFTLWTIMQITYGDDETDILDKCITFNDLFPDINITKNPDCWAIYGGITRDNETGVDNNGDRY